MMVRPKTKRRVVILLVGALLLTLSAGGAYVLRKRQIMQRARISYQEGIAALQAGDYPTALHKIGTYIGRFPDDLAAVQKYAQARVKVPEPNGKHLLDAMGQYGRIVNRQPENLEAQHALLELYLLIPGGTTESITTAQAILDRKPDDPAALRGMITGMDRTRRFDKALALAQRLNTLDPLNVQDQIRTLELMRRAAKPEKEIIDHATKLSQAHLEDGRFELLLAYAYIQGQDPVQAKLWTRKAAGRDIDEPQLVNLMVNLLDGLDLFEESFAFLDRASQKPAAGALRPKLFLRLVQAERYQDVSTRLANLSATDKTVSVELLAYRALALLNLKQQPAALEIINALMARQADTLAMAWGGLLKAIADLPDAPPSAMIAACQKAQSLSALSPLVPLYLGDAYDRLNERDLALRHWSEAANSAPAWASPLVRLSGVLLAKGYRQDALNYAEGARLRAPQDPAALASLATAMAANADPSKPVPAELMQLIEKVQTLRPGEEQTQGLKIVLLAKSQQPQAVELAKSVISASPPPSGNMLLQLASLSRSRQLGLEELCFDRYQKEYGVTPDLALAKARGLFDSSRAADGLALIQAAKAAPHKGDDFAWQMAQARYLELMQHPTAKAAVIALGDGNPTKLEAQWLALGARSARDDRAFVGRTIDRLKVQIGDQGLSWRQARAQWLLEGQSGDREIAEATSLLGEVIRVAPDLVPPRLLLADALQRLGNIRGAIEQLTAVATRLPASNGIALDLARLLLKQGDVARAREYLDRVVEAKTATSAERRAAAGLLAQQGDSERALKIFEEIAAQDPAQAPDLAMAALYAQRNQPDKAEPLFRKLLEKPDLAIISQAINFYLAQGRQADAEAVLALVDKVPAEAGIKELMRGEYCLRSGAADRALEQFRLATKAAPSNPATWRELLACLIRMGKPADALAAADLAQKAIAGDTVIEAVRRNAQLVTELASEPAMRPMLGALLQPGGDIAPVVECLRLLADAKRTNEATASLVLKLRPLADRNSRLQPLQILVARLYASNRRFDDALTVSARAMQAFPNSAEPAQIATESLMQQGKWSEALAMADQWRQRTLPQPLSADLAIAGAHLGLNHAQAAVTQLQPYLKQAQADPDTHGPVLAGYTRALIRLKQTDQAAAVLKPLLAKGPQWRGLWIQLAVSQIADAVVAASWLTEVSALVPPGDIEQQMGLAMGWFQLAKRSDKPQAKQAARAILAQITKDANAGGNVPPSVLMVLGMLQEDDGDLAAAQASYRQVLKLDPKQPIAMNNLAMILVNSGGDLAEALTLAKQAASAEHPDKASFYDTLATVHAKSKDFPAALAAIQEALRAKSDNIEYRINLVQILADSGQVEKARAELVQLESLQPDPARMTKSALQRLDALRKALKPAA